MTSRETILERLRNVKQPFPDKQPIETYLPMVPSGSTTTVELLARFIDQAEKADCVVHQVKTSEHAIETVLSLIEEDKVISSWDPGSIPIPGLEAALENADITCREQDANTRIGLTAVDAALAATGSIIVSSGRGRSRTASLLPPVHIAVVDAKQVFPDLESWFAGQKEAGLENIRQHSNIIVITGPSRTADIAMQLVMGMHGPLKMHIVLVE